MQRVSSEIAIKIHRYRAAIDVMIKRELPQLREDLIPTVRARCFSAIAGSLHKWRKYRGRKNAWIYCTLVYTIRDIRKSLERNGTISVVALDAVADVVYSKESIDCFD